MAALRAELRVDEDGARIEGAIVRTLETLPRRTRIGSRSEGERPVGFDRAAHPAGFGSSSTRAKPGFAPISIHLVMTIYEQHNAPFR